jgi:hypothetical protein
MSAAPQAVFINIRPCCRVQQSLASEIPELHPELFDEGLGINDDQWGSFIPKLPITYLQGKPQILLSTCCHGAETGQGNNNQVQQATHQKPLGVMAAWHSPRLCRNTCGQPRSVLWRYFWVLFSI